MFQLRVLRGRGDRHDPKKVYRYRCNRWGAWPFGHRTGQRCQCRSGATDVADCGSACAVGRLARRWRWLARRWWRLARRPRLAWRWGPRLGWPRFLGWPAASSLSLRRLLLIASPVALPHTAARRLALSSEDLTLRSRDHETMGERPGARDRRLLSVEHTHERGSGRHSANQRPRTEKSQNTILWPVGSRTGT
jgi:hypothetical protein